MGLCAASVIIGLILLAFIRQLGVDMISYGIVLALFASSFFFIVRSRFLRAKLAYRALQYAKEKTHKEDATERLNAGR